MTVRAKFRVDRIVKTAAQPEAAEITLSPQYDKSIPEDQNFSKATPSGTMTLYVTNLPAIEALGLGKFFYVDFNEVPAS